MPKRSAKSASRLEERQTRPRAQKSAKTNTDLQFLGEPNAPNVKPLRVAVKPLNDAQRRYDAAMRSGEVIFGVGPAGTGKTWLAAMRAAEMLDKGVIEKIIVTRPAVEAGEKLGFLPGELDEKYEPYFRPVRDAFEKYFGSGKTEYLIRTGKIEARPLALLRGASIDNAWIIADEMQNATRTQFKLLLTRGGKGTKFVVNGDPRQTDLPRGQSGLMDAVRRLEHVQGIETVLFDKSDIVRSGLTQRIVEAFEDDGAVNDNAGLTRTLRVG